MCSFRVNDHKWKVNIFFFNRYSTDFTLIYHEFYYIFSGFYHFQYETYEYNKWVFIILSFLIFFLELFNIQCDSFNSFYQLNYNGVVERTLYWWLYPLESNKLLYFLIEWIIYHFLPRWPFQRNLIWSDLSRFLCSKSICDFFITINNGIVGKLQFLVYCHFLLFVM